MSRSNRLGRSLGVASIALILVAGAAFAHDAIVDAPHPDGSSELVTSIEPDVPAAEVDEPGTIDRDEIDDAIGGAPDVDEPAEAQDPEDAADPVKPAKVEQHAAKPAKAAKATKTARAASATDQNGDENDADEADDNEQHDGDHQGGGNQDGEHQGDDQGDSDHGGDD